MTRPETIASDLDRAVEQIQQRGWTRGQHTDPKTGGVCMYGAVDEALKSKGVWGWLRTVRMMRAQRAITVTLREEYGWHGEMTTWNDLKARDRRQVMAALKKTAKRLRGQS